MNSMAYKAEQNIDNEWAKFISNNNYESSSDEDDNYDFAQFNQNEETFVSADMSFDFNMETPKASDIYISTKTNIVYLNTSIDLKEVFWKILVIPYAKPTNGVIKKQMKFNSTTQEELSDIIEKLKYETYYEERIITNINNPNGRIKFKDIRKVSVGVSKKDLMSYRCKKKSAFYNCFVLILRININNVFKEFHVKVFNTGKLEIPGIQNDNTFKMILQLVIETLQPFVPETLHYKEDSEETVLINSNFNCGFFINRDILNDILKYKYNIQSIYDPCSYPGIQCKFYYNPDVPTQTGSQISEENKESYKNIKKISFMIFRTGSVLIVGKCDENILMTIYEFLKDLLVKEFNVISQKFHYDMNSVIEKNNEKIKKRKIMKI